MSQQMKFLIDELPNKYKDLKPILWEISREIDNKSFPPSHRHRMSGNVMTDWDQYQAMPPTTASLEQKDSASTLQETNIKALLSGVDTDLIDQKIQPSLPSGQVDTESGLVEQLLELQARLAEALQLCAKIRVPDAAPMLSTSPKQELNQSVPEQEAAQSQSKLSDRPMNNKEIAIWLAGYTRQNQKDALWTVEHIISFVKERL